MSFTGRPVGFVDEALAKLGRARHVAMTVNQFYTAGRVVASTDLLTVLPLGFVPMTGMAEQLAVRDIPLELHTVEIDALGTATRSTWLATGGFASSCCKRRTIAGHEPHAPRLP